MRVICNIPNGSDNISGVQFGPQESGQRVSEEISEAQGQRFLSIPGFLEYKERPSSASSSASAEAHAQDEGGDGDEKTDDATGNLNGPDGAGDSQAAGGPDGPGDDKTDGVATGDLTAQTGDGKPAAPAAQAPKLAEAKTPPTKKKK